MQGRDIVKDFSEIAAHIANPMVAHKFVQVAGEYFLMMSLLKYIAQDDSNPTFKQMAQEILIELSKE